MATLAAARGSFCSPVTFHHPSEASTSSAGAKGLPCWQSGRTLSGFGSAERRGKTRGTKGRRWGPVRMAAAAKEDPKAGVMVYKPKTFEEILDKVTTSVKFGLDDGLLRMEVEFPPLPASSSAYASSSDKFIDANLQLALTLGRKLKENYGLKSKIVLPDKVELKRAAKMFKYAVELVQGVSLGSLEDCSSGSSKGFFGAVRSALDLDFSGDDPSSDFTTTEPVDLHIIVNTSAVELPGVETYANEFCKDIPMAIFNLELDTLRSDLGLFGFPPKDLHYRFLSTFKPIFYIRPRDYARSINAPPYVVNYSGCLLRIYPGPWQVMLKQTDSTYACIAEDQDRFTLGEVKAELLTSLGLNMEEPGSAMAFFRTGYKTTTWWEDDIKLEQSSSWRT